MTAIEMDPAMESRNKDSEQWGRVMDLFDRFLDGADPDSAAALEPDEEIRATALDLWRHHLQAVGENYLGSPIEFEVTHRFQPGQRLLDRFRVERKLGSGGMGEVYLAWDERMEGPVALKTIARLLVPSEAIRKRFLAEVRNARQVTHDNVCRIHELFEEGETAFFSMEYLDGTLLSDASERLSARERLTVLTQIAQGMRAAHSKGVIHGDLKPSNIMLMQGDSGRRAVIMDFGLARAVDAGGPLAGAGLSLGAGTVEYMAPELAASAPTVSSDIYAFGRIGKSLLPKQRIWDECIRAKPEERIASFTEIVRRLDPVWSRRFWVRGLAIGAAGAAGYSLRQGSGVKVSLPANARVFVNGFRAAENDTAGARLTRAWLLASLQQSSKVRAIEDHDSIDALQKLDPAALLPLSGLVLERLTKRIRAAFWIEGDLRRLAGEYSLDARIMDAQRQTVVAASVFGSADNLTVLAEDAAMWVRKTAGESEQLLRSNSGKLASFTSKIPEAVDLYFQALELRGRGKPSQAIPLLTEAIRLDPDFAQAHHLLALTYNGEYRLEESFNEIESARKIADRLPERERIPITLTWYRMTEDYPHAIETARQALIYHSDEPRYHMELGQTLAWNGQLEEGADSLRSAVHIAPEDPTATGTLAAALTQGERFDEALGFLKTMLANQPEYKWTNGSLGCVYWTMGQYPEALAAFRQESGDSENSANVVAVRILQGEFDLAIAAATTWLAGAKDNPVRRYHANEFLCGLYFITGRVNAARERVSEMAEMKAYPLMGKYLSGAASWARRIGQEAALDRIHHTVKEIARRWPNNYSEGQVRHIEGLRAWLKGDSERAATDLLQSFGLAYDLGTVFDLGELYTAQGSWRLAEEYWARFEARRGTLIVRGLFPGLLPLAWAHRSQAAFGRKDMASARSNARKVLDQWSRSRPVPHAVLTASQIYAASQLN